MKINRIVYIYKDKPQQQIERPEEELTWPTVMYYKILMNNSKNRFFWLPRIGREKEKINLEIEQQKAYIHFKLSVYRKPKLTGEIFPERRWKRIERRFVKSARRWVAKNVGTKNAWTVPQPTCEIELIESEQK